MRKIWKKVKLSFDRSFSDSWWKQLLWLCGIALLLIFIGWVILVAHNGAKDTSMWKSISYFLDTNSFHNDIDSTMKVPPLFTVIFTFLGMAVMSGALISVIVNILTTRVEDFRKGHKRYSFSRQVAIVGSGDMLVSMIRHFCCGAKNDIVILTSSDVEQLRNKLKTCLVEKELRRVTLLYGRRDSKTELLRAKIWRAERIYITGEDNEQEHDTTNIHCLELIRDICNEKKNKTPIPCNVTFEYHSSILAVRYARYKNILTQKGGHRLLDLSVTNLYESWAQNVFVSGCSGEITYLPLDRGGITIDSDKFVHLVVVTMTRMGCAMAETAAHIAHFPNFIKGKKTLITFIDPNAGREKDFFTGRHETLFELSKWSFCSARENRHEEHIPSGEDFLDVEWEFIEGTIEMPEIRAMIAEWSADSERLLTLAVCGNSPSANAASAIHLPREVYDKKIPVLVYQRGDSALIDIAGLSGKYGNLRAFGMLSGLFDPANEARMRDGKKIMYLYDYFLARSQDAESIPSDAQLDNAWNDISFDLQMSNIYAANTIPTKYRSVGLAPQQMLSHDFTEEQILILSEMEHRRWIMEKLLLGYRPLTEKETADVDQNPLRKAYYKEKYFAHYDLRPYNQLKVDITGCPVSQYDRCIIKGFKLIVTENNK